MRTAIAIVQDDDSEAKEICGYFDRYSEEYDCIFDVKRFPSGENFIAGYGKGADIIFLDISLFDADGIRIAQELRRMDERAVVILLSESPQRAIEGYSVHAFDFVLKPMTYAAFCDVLKRALLACGRRIEGVIGIHATNGIVNLPISDVHYIEVMLHYLTYHTQRGDIVARGVMKDEAERLRPFHFVRISHSYLVNLRHAEKMEEDILIVAGQNLKISRSRKQEVQVAFGNYIGDIGI